MATAEEGPDSLVLATLRRIDSRLDRLADDMREETCASLSRRLDRLEERVERIERRLDLVDSPAT